MKDFKTERLRTAKENYNTEYQKVQETIVSINTQMQINTARQFVNIFNEKYKDDSDFPEVHYQTMYLFGMLAGVIACRFNKS